MDAAAPAVLAEGFDTPTPPNLVAALAKPPFKLTYNGCSIGAGKSIPSSCPPPLRGCAGDPGACTATCLSFGTESWGRSCWDYR